MSNQTNHTIVRLRVPPELKNKIEESAEKNNRSQSAEMVARLEQSFEAQISHEFEMHMMEIMLKEQQEKLNNLTQAIDNVTKLVSGR
ncbi:MULTISPECIES: Arc family DNA-binding protein [Acinetobacter]|uniref:Arc-like DNA binding domain-containing protein n=2 Tax=Acinetobacter TaxID=469 RepID=N9C105_9GAMM|nr:MULTISPECIES: Arc family DNA-binding protein [Acinetobacter]ENV79517.1 hypothetical protein F942_01825 [Acinetobacter ursingii ANC 3649]QXZ23292.1 Arc family DNA-binding protein [Acinetobacter septicus]